MCTYRCNTFGVLYALSFSSIKTDNGVQSVHWVGYEPIPIKGARSVFIIHIQVLSEVTRMRCVPVSPVASPIACCNHIHIILERILKLFCKTKRFPSTTEIKVLFHHPKKNILIFVCRQKRQTQRIADEQKVIEYTFLRYKRFVGRLKFLATADGSANSYENWQDVLRDQKGELLLNSFGNLSQIYIYLNFSFSGNSSQLKNKILN